MRSNRGSRGAQIGFKKSITLKSRHGKTKTEELPLPPKTVYISFKDRTCGNKVCRMLYKLFKIFYVCFWFYFSPFTILFLSYYLPFIMSEYSEQERVRPIVDAEIEGQAQEIALVML